MGENIEKLFKQEIRNKKRVGSNIFSRKSTRKGGTNQALRTPYAFMNKKEREKLSGEVVSYNVNEVMKHEELIKLPKQRQKELLERWREQYSVKELTKGLQVSSNTFYDTLRRLGLKINEGVVGGHTVKRVELPKEEMDKYLHGEFIDFNIFKKITREQQAELLEAYMDVEPVLSELCRTWEGSDLSYIYNVRYAINKSKKKAEAQEEAQQELNLKEDIKEESQETADEQEQDNIIEETETPMTSTDTIENGSATTTHTTTTTENEGGSVDTSYTVAPNIPNTHTSNIEVEGNSFNFELKGQYKAEAIIRRINFVLEELKDSDELLNLELKISNK